MFALQKLIAKLIEKLVDYLKNAKD